MTHTFGIHHSISNEDYHSTKQIEGHTAVSSSFAKAWHNLTPAHAVADKPFRTSTAFDIGTATHSWALEGVLPTKGPATRRGAAWQNAVAEAELLGSTALTESDYERVEQMVQALHRNPAIDKLLSHKQGIVEASVFALHDSGICMKARPDLYLEKQGIMVDLKTTQSAEPYDFERKGIHGLGYGLQAAWYCKTLSLAGVDIKRFLFANVEKEPPFATSIVEVGDALMKHCSEAVERILQEITEAEQTNTYATGWPTVHVAQLPAWLD
jgi:hypothetical protein